MQYRSAAVAVAVGALMAVLAGDPTPAPAAFRIGQNFTGSSQADAEFGAIPPDTMGAAGPKQFVELLNGLYAVYDKATGALLEAKTQNDFWRDAGIPLGRQFEEGSFDPRIVFDPGSSHWFASALAGEQ